MGYHHGGSKIALVYHYGGMCTETYTHPYDLTVEAMRNLNNDELTKLQAEIRVRKRNLKEGREVLVGMLRPSETK